MLVKTKNTIFIHGITFGCLPQFQFILAGTLNDFWKTYFWFQVVSYGVGGHYEPHVDYYGEYLDEFHRGDRIATLLFYLNDVTFGGATVFPFLGLAVQPVKGSALFWYNLRFVLPFKDFVRRVKVFVKQMSIISRGLTLKKHNSFYERKTLFFSFNLFRQDGSGDRMTVHAACPVLFGRKWVANQWIRERGQEFRRKCKLMPEQDWTVYCT